MIVIFISFMPGFKTHVTVFRLLVILCWRVERIRWNCMKLPIFTNMTRKVAVSYSST